METYVFEGSSDDTFGEYGVTNDDYDNCANGEPIQYELKLPDGTGVIVTGMYGNDMSHGDGWMIGVNTLDEDKPVDQWVFSMHPSYYGYRNRLVVSVPGKATLKCLNRKGDEE